MALNIITDAQDAGFTLGEIRRLRGDRSRRYDGALIGTLRKSDASLKWCSTPPLWHIDTVGGASTPS